ncbi:CvpA family protein [bacterium]|nr:CvpA family protein [bacterium]
MTLDIILAVFILLAMVAGYLCGGFKEIFKLVVFTVIFAALKIPSLENTMQELAGPKFYTTLYIFTFIISYFLIYKILFFVLRDLIKEKEGALGKTNKMLGIIFGFFKGIAVIFVMIYIFDSLVKHNIFIELKPYTEDSILYAVSKIVMNKTGLVFF